MANIDRVIASLPLGDRFTVHDAIILAAAAHYGQVDEGRPSLPYVTHPLRLLSAFDDEGLQMAAVLHDAIEDSKGQVTAETLRQLGVPSEVIQGVEALTHRRGEPREDYIVRLKRDPVALAVKLEDNRDNSDEARLADLPPERAAHFRAKYARDRTLLNTAPDV